MTERPNFEKIASVYFHEKAKKSHTVPMLEKNWDLISNGEFGEIYSDKLLTLLKRFQLESHLSDFLLLAYAFKDDIESFKLMREGFEKFAQKKFEDQLIASIKLLSDSNFNASIIISTPKNGSCKIDHRELCSALFKNHWSRFMDYFYSELNEKERSVRRKDYVEPVYRKWLEEHIKAGRKRGNPIIKKIIFIIWQYLQEATKLTAADGKEYSNEQARFIFDFMELFGLWSDHNKISKKEDVVGYYLKDYKNNSRKY